MYAMAYDILPFNFYKNVTYLNVHIMQLINCRTYVILLICQNPGHYLELCCFDYELDHNINFLPRLSKCAVYRDHSIIFNRPRAGHK